MKYRTECIQCGVGRAIYEANELIGSEGDRFKILKEVLALLSENVSIHRVPAEIGTLREKLFARYFNGRDPFFELKHLCNKEAEEIIPFIKEYYKKADDKIEALLRIMALGNSMEFGVKDHDFKLGAFKNEVDAILKEPLSTDMDEVKARLQRFEKILYLTDNAGVCRCGECSMFLSEMFFENILRKKVYITRLM